MSSTTVQEIIFRVRVSSRQNAYPTLFPGDKAVLVRAKRISKIGRRKYVYMTAIVHPMTNKPVLVPTHTWAYLQWNGKEWNDPPGLGSIMWGDDHNPDIWNKHDK